jgi:uncharacterized protein (DUF1499 family)
MSIAPGASAPQSKRARWPAVLVRVALVAAIIACILLIVAGPGYRLGLLPLVPALLATALGFVFFLLAFVIGGIGWLFRRRSARPLARGTTFMLGLDALVSVFGIVFVVHASGTPPIHDVTTDVDDPPAFKAVLAARAAGGAQNPPDYRRTQEVRGTMLDVAEAQRTAYPNLLPIDSSDAPATLMPLAEKAARDMGWEIVATDPTEGTVEATATTRYFGFKDDIVVRIRPVSSGARIDVRSESRVGLGDAGTNASRVSTYLAKLRAVIGQAPAAH